MFLGVDLGTTYSVGAYIDENGEPQVVINSEGSRITPSVVYFENTDSVIVGQTAKDNSIINPSDVVSTVKNHMGEQKHYKSSVGQEYTPEVISSLIIRKIVEDAEKYLNTSEKIKDIVVTIPAYFKDAQRKATEDAIHIAGLNLLGTINEPTAAALYYAVKIKMNHANILIYDLGGGTFDVTIIRIDDDEINVKSTGGLSKVGGCFFDQEIVDYVCKEIEGKYGINLKEDEYLDIYQELYERAEKAKIQLSNQEKAMVTVRAGNIRENVVITREFFEGIVAKLYKRTEFSVKKAVKDAGLSLAEINKAILVGGSTRIPYIEQHLSELLGIQMSHEVNPDEVVAMGAALYAKQLVSADVKKTIHDVCSHSIGVVTIDRTTLKKVNSILIKRNTKIPVEVTQKFRTVVDNQEEIELSVTEGEFTEISDVVVLNSTRLTLPDRLVAGTSVDIRLQLDEAQLVHVYIVIPSIGYEKEYKFKRNANLSEEEVALFTGIIADFEIGKQKQISVECETIKKEEVENEIQKEIIQDVKSSKASKKEPKVIPAIEDCFEGIVGMHELKESLNDIYALLLLEKKRKKIGFARTVIRNNIVITGPDGCGKTTAAYAASKVLKNLGIVGLEEPFETDYANILGEKQEDTHENIKELFEKAEDGIILIENVHEFNDAGAYAMGLDALDEIVKAYHASENRITLIFTGNKEGIDDLFVKNKKLKDIFQLDPIVLGHYTADELVMISHHLADEKNFILDEEVDLLLQEKMKQMMKQPDFRYSKDLERILNEAFIQAARRLSKKRRLSEEDAMLLSVEDFQFGDSQETVEELLAQLDNMIGLTEVKIQVKKIVNSVKMQKKAKEMGIELADGHGTLHLVFKGNAGTGKTTVARIIGKIYKRLGVLSGGQLIEVTRRDLVAEFVGKTAIQVQSKVKEAMGGILFIDEAYSLCKGDDDSYGQEAIDALVADIENHRDSLMVILAGYSTDMDKFLDKNQGLRSRLSTEIHFEDYSVDEMVEIFKENVKGRGLVLEADIEKDIHKLLKDKSRQRDFGNGRGVRNVFESVLLNQNNRLSQKDAGTLSKNDFLIIRKEDLQLEQEQDTKEDKVQMYLDRLNALTGLEAVKQKVNRIVDTVQVNKKMEELGLERQEFGTLHLVFKGNAGTGKTTVARLLGQIYKELDVLSNGKIVECGRSDLVAGYAGQTAMKVREKVREAMGGILFIDEAYALCYGKEDTYGQEAIDTLVADIENYRKDFMVIIAGYSEDMDGFLEKNQGLSSRFSNEIIFDDYTLEEMCSIFKGMVHDKNLTITTEALELVREILIQRSKAKNFGNARGVRNILDVIQEQRNMRIARMIRSGVKVMKEDALQIVEEDIRGLN